MQSTLQYQGAYSFGDSQRTQWFILKNQQIPGPGTHQIKFQTSNPKWSVGKQKKGASFIPPHDNAPVGNYQISQQQILRASKKYSIPVAKRQQKLNQLTSQVNHDPQHTFTKQRSPIYTMGYTQPYSYQTQVPAPNIYNNQKQRSKSEFNRTQNHFTIGDRGSPYQGREKHPGVGNYNLYTLQNHSPKIKFAQSKRPPNQISKDSPGKYYQKVAGNMKRNNLGATLSMRFRERKQIQTPGPSNYNPIYPQRQKKIVTLTSQRSEMVIKQHGTHPNPGHYNLAGQLERGIGFPNSIRPQVELNDFPGPGKYQTVSTLNNTLGKMGWKLQKQKKLITPSPLNYKPNTSYTQKRPPNPLNLYSNRIDFSKSDTQEIGPGAYNLRGGLSKQLGKMGRSERFKMRNQNPGPGEYNISHTIGRLPKYLKHIKRKIGQNGQTKVIKYDPEIFFPKKIEPKINLQNSGSSQIIV